MVENTSNFSLQIDVKILGARFIVIQIRYESRIKCFLHNNRLIRWCSAHILAIANIDPTPPMVGLALDW